MLAGTELRKERNLGEVLTDSFNILISYWRPLATIAVPAVVANLTLSLVLLAIAPDWLTSEDAFSEPLTDEQQEDVLLLTAVGLAFLPVLLVLSTFTSAATVQFLDRTNNDTSVQPSEAMDTAQDKLGSLTGATLRATLIVFAFTITLLGIPLAVYRVVRWAFISQAIIMEDKGASDALASSAVLVKGRWWITAGRLLATFLVITIPVGLLQQALVAALPGVLGSILSGLASFVTISYFAVAVALMYFDLRTRKSEAPSPSSQEDPSFPTG